MGQQNTNDRNEARRRAINPRPTSKPIATQADAESWFASARAGAMVVYHRGPSLALAKAETELVRDAMTGEVELSLRRLAPRRRRTRDARHLEEVCGWLHGMSDTGRIALTQKRVCKPDEFGEGAVYEFRATKVW